MYASPLTVSPLLRHVYVDDLLKCLDTIEDVHTLYREIIQLFAKSGFELRKWSTNTPEVYLEIPEDQRAATNMLLQEPNSPRTIQGALGLRWNPQTGHLTLDEKAEKTVILMRRGMLSVLHSFFDPLGFTVPFLL